MIRLEEVCSKNELQSTDVVYQQIQYGQWNFLLVATGKGICQACFVEQDADVLTQMMFSFASITKGSNAWIDLAIEQLCNPVFDCDLVLHVYGTSFQKTVWKALLEIPFGAMVTYAHVAAAIDQPLAVRAVASAIARNPVAVFIPCHRVVPAVGGVGQYRWGSERKIWLLNNEGVNVK